MAKKVDQQVFERIKKLRFQYELSIAVIATRLGLSQRTVKYMLRAARTGEKPYNTNHAVRRPD